MFPITQNNEEGSEVLAVAEVTLHTTWTSVGAGDEVATLAQHQSKPVYWNSSETAIKGENVYAGLRQRVTLLEWALQKPDGYKSILQPSDETLNADQVFKITRNKCVFLIRAYQIALEKLGTNNTSRKKDCFQEAVNQINDIGFDTTVIAIQLLMQILKWIGTSTSGSMRSFTTLIYICCCK